MYVCLFVIIDLLYYYYDLVSRVFPLSLPHKLCCRGIILLLSLQIVFLEQTDLLNIIITTYYSYNQY